jgi:hypothetical protein
MGGGGGSEKSTGSLPWWARDAHATLINKAEEFAYGDRGSWVPYPDARIAGFTDQEIAAQQARQEMFNRGDPSQQFAADQYSLASGLGGQITDYATREFTNDEMSRRMSPFMEGVINPQLRQVNESYDSRLNQSEADSVARGGAIGSYRVGIENAGLQQDRAQTLSDVRGAGQQAAYESALKSFESDRATGIGGLSDAAAMYGDIGARASRLGIDSQAAELQRINELERSGAVNREMTQAEYDLAQKDFYEERDWPMRNMSYLSSILSGVPAGIGTTETSYGSPNFASQAASLGIAGAGIGQLVNSD